MRMYDTRIARFASLDPLFTQFPFYTPYQFAGNKPIWAIDLDGLEEWTATRQPVNGRMTTMFVYNAGHVGEGVEYIFKRANGTVYYTILLPDFIQGTSDETSAKGHLSYYEKEDDYRSRTNLKRGPLGENGREIAQGNILAANGERLEKHGYGKKIPTLQEFYDTDQSTVVSQAINASKVAEYLIENPGLSAEIVGYTDRQGSEEYNQGLGLRRAVEIKEEMINYVQNSGLYSSEQIEDLKSRISCRSVGESAATSAGDVDGQDNADFRTTKININE